MGLAATVVFFTNEAQFTQIQVFFRECSLQNEVGDPPSFFTFLALLTRHLSMVKFSEKNAFQHDACLHNAIQLLINACSIWQIWYQLLNNEFCHRYTSIKVLYLTNKQLPCTSERISTRFRAVAVIFVINLLFSILERADKAFLF